MGTLWEIDSRIEELTMNLIDEETGEINEEAMEELESLDMDRKDKLESCGCLIKDLTAQVDAIKSEKDSLDKRMKVKMNRIASISRYINNSLKGEAMETPKVAFSYRKSEKVDVVNEDAVPDDYCRFETKRTPSKTDIKKALKEGKEVPGCVLVENQNLQIK